MIALNTPFYVLPYQQRDWAIRRADSEKAGVIRVFSDKSQAIKEAEKIALDAGTVLIVYDVNGQIERVTDPETDLKFKPEFQEQIERHLRGEEELIDFDEAMKALGLDE
ncbi:MAG: hypothetical protein BroJett018_46430 [Chloroflexota bacterium]|nr:MAG: hypothetical protein BroJett018_46430 [Chloroflexota bacterium]